MSASRLRGGLRVALAAIALVTSIGASALDGAEERGKQIYLQGSSSRAGTIEAIVGDEAVALPASAVPCASCHGPDGLGRPEGGLLPPDIRWSELTKTYGHVHENGRRHPAFDEKSLARLLSAGLDPADNRLDTAMPLYRMSEADMDDLVAYLKQLERERDPGIDGERIQVGSLLPLEGRGARLGQAMAQAMHAHFQDINAQGGIYGRRIELLAVPLGASPKESLGNLSAALRTEGVFALVGAYTVGVDREILELTRAEDMPLVGPFTLDPGDAVADAAAFYMYPGFDEQARVLAEQALAASASERMLVVGPEGKRVDRLIRAVRDQVGTRATGEPFVARYSSGEFEARSLVKQSLESEAGALIFFGDQVELEALLDELAAKKREPRVYVLSSFLARPLFDVPSAFHERLFIAYPTFSSDITAEGRAAYEELAERHALPRDHVQAQIAAFAAARLLVEGLRRAGRDLNRLRLIGALEQLYAFDTGLTPPLTYGPNRRIGARGAHVVTVNLVDRTYEPVGGWHDLR